MGKLDAKLGNKEIIANREDKDNESVQWSSLVTLAQATKQARIITHGCDERSFSADFKMTKGSKLF